MEHGGQEKRRTGKTENWRTGKPERIEIFRNLLRGWSWR